MKNSFRLLGRLGENKPKLQLCDFRRQQGIYILFDDYGPYYVGLARAQDRGLGQRLKEHLEGKYAGKWDRFSWFGFNKVSNERDNNNVCTLATGDENLSSDTRTTIAELEALLILATGPKANIAQMRFSAGDQWLQIPYDAVESYLARIAV